MTTHQYLNQIYWLNEKIKSLTLYEERLRSEAEQIRTSSFDQIRVGGSARRDASAIIARLVDCEAELAKVKLEMISRRDRIVKEIHGLEIEEDGRLKCGDYVELLTRRYILFEKYTKIAEDMNYTEKHIFRLRKAALAAFEEKYGGGYVNA